MEDKINKSESGEKSLDSATTQVTEVTAKATDTTDIDKDGGAVASSMTKDLKVKSNKKKFIILAVVVLLLVIVAIVIVVILLNCNSKELGSDDATKTDTAVKEDTNSDANVSEGTTTSNDEPVNLSPEEKVKAILARVRSKIASDKLSISDSDDYAPDYRAEGMKAYTRLYKGIGLSVKTADNRDEETSNYLMSDEFANLVVGELLSAGFEDYGSTLWYRGSYLNPESGVVCVVVTKVEPVDLWCGHTSWISEDTKALVNELAEAVAVSDEEFEDPDALILDVLGKVPQDSSYKPYQTLAVGISSHGGLGGAVGLFYRTSPDAKWQFFTVSQGPLLCSDYDTVDLQKAYMGVGCWDEINKQDSVVTLK